MWRCVGIWIRPRGGAVNAAILLTPVSTPPAIHSNSIDIWRTRQVGILVSIGIGLERALDLKDQPS